jgi:hypothetical protein
MGYRELLPYNVDCEHPTVAFDEKVDKRGNTKTVEVECRQCGDKVVEDA